MTIERYFVLDDKENITMKIDNLYSERYFILDNDEWQVGWENGIRLTQTKGSPRVDLEVIPVKTELANQTNKAEPLDMYEIWPDTIDYSQNIRKGGNLSPSEDIMPYIKKLDSRCFDSDLEKNFYLNIMRVPLCKLYLTACAKVKPKTILELGTGGNSGHSTGMFLYWLNGSGKLISVDRHYLSSVWPRYRENKNWVFIQGDSITVMKKLMATDSTKRFDMIFIDSSHTYPHTLKEIEQASMMTNAILLDDTTISVVNRSINEFRRKDKNWLCIDLDSGVKLLERHNLL